MISPGLTVTGADERTDIDHLVSQLPTKAEIGILLSLNPEGRHRYPSLAWVDMVVRRYPRRCAVHICGRSARHALRSGSLNGWSQLVPRFQINGHVTADEFVAISNQIEEIPLITQLAPDVNESLVAMAQPRHQILLDASGGRGIMPAQWDAPVTHKAVGFAGGLGVSTLGSAWPHIISTAKAGSWIDMEGKLRDERDWFSVEAAVEVARIHQYLCSQAFTDYESNKGSPS
jgi:hypothetical protein